MQRRIGRNTSEPPCGTTRVSIDNHRPCHDLETQVSTADTVTEEVMFIVGEEPIRVADAVQRARVWYFDWSDDAELLICVDFLL